MAVADITAARDAIFGRFGAVWAAAWASPPGPDGENAAPAILYQGKKQDTPKDGSSYVKVRVQHVLGFQATLRDAANGARFRSLGQVWVDIYGPPEDGLTANDAYVKVTQSAFEGHQTSPDGVLFRGVRVREMGGDGVHEHTIVIADFEYDRIV